MSTPRERLVKLLDHYISRSGNCSCGHQLMRPWDHSEIQQHVADAIIQAGWQPPIPEQPNVVLDN